jgi:hypothetical protein
MVLIDNDISSMYPGSVENPRSRVFWAQIDEEHRMRVLNKKYWPYHVKAETTDKQERWCYENLKSSEWRNVGSYFAFKREQDAMMFTLKWS